MSFKYDNLRCRTCSTSISNVDSIHLFIKNENYTTLTYGEILMECTSIQIDKNDCLPQYICFACKEKAKNSYEFKKLCEKTDEQLRNELVDMVKSDEIKNYYENNETYENYLDENNVSFSEEENNQFDEDFKFETKKNLKKSKNDSKTPGTICRACNLNFVEFNLLKKHIAEEHPGEVSCYTCQKVFPNYSKMNKHAYDAHFFQIIERKCPYCNKMYKRYSAYNAHVSKCNPDADKTEVTKSKTGSIKDEIKEELDGNDYAIDETNSLLDTSKVKIRTLCLVCNVDQITKLNLEAHVMSEHPERPLKCMFCSFNCDNYDILNSHVYDNHIHKKEIKCPCCNRKFPNSEFLKRHMKAAHNEINIKKIYDLKLLKKPPRNRFCYACDVEIKDLRTYAHHVRTEHPGEVSCSKCGKVCTDYSKLIKHRKHHVRANIKCPYCERVYSHTKYLNAHIAYIHKANDSLFAKYRKTILCQMCGQNFKNASSLRNHLRKHTGETPYKCNLCDKSFALLNTLKYHRMRHSQVKRWSCELCGRRYYQKSSLTKHRESTHQNIRKYPCDKCDKNFTERKRLKEHFESVHLGIRHNCSQCGSQFSYFKGLKGHMKKHHEAEINEKNYF